MFRFRQTHSLIACALFGEQQTKGKKVYTHRFLCVLELWTEFECIVLFMDDEYEFMWNTKNTYTFAVEKKEKKF